MGDYTLENWNVSEFIYFIKYNDQYKGLINLLFYKAKMACFFEKERDEERLDLLSEVINFKEWREIEHYKIKK